MAAKADAQIATFDSASELAYLRYQWRRVHRLLFPVHKLGNIQTLLLLLKVVTEALFTARMHPDIPLRRMFHLYGPTVANSLISEGRKDPFITFIA